MSVLSSDTILSMIPSFTQMDKKYLPLVTAAAGAAVAGLAVLVLANFKAGEKKSANVADNAYVLLVRIRAKPGRAHDVRQHVASCAAINRILQLPLQSQSGIISSRVLRHTLTIEMVPI